MKNLLLFALLLPVFCKAQIKLPKGFKCVISEDSWRDNYFTDGTLNFNTDAYGSVETIENMLDALKNETKLPFHKTKDRLYIFTGKVKDIYVYIIAIPDNLVVVKLSSKTNNKDFSDQSIWILQQVRNNREANKDYYFEDWKGKTCSSY